MYDVLSSIRDLLVLDEICIDNNIFRLHYKATLFILVAFSILVTQTQYLGDPIDCMSNTNVDDDLLDSFCWILSTYTLPDVKNGAHAGVSNPFNSSGEKHKKKHHTYYQWVTLFLYFQALSFYIPRYLWKIWEGGKMKMLVEGLRMPVINEEEQGKKKEALLTFFKTNLHNNNSYAFKFILCEVLNFVNVIMQIIMANEFVGRDFSNYGLKVIGQTESAFFSRNDTLEYVFPKVTKCDFHYYGPSGSKQNVDAICVLPLNVFNEKIFIILWFWFIGVAVISALSLLYRLATFHPAVRQMTLRAKAKICNPDDVNIVSSDCRFGDWFLLYQIAKNMDLTIFRECIQDLAKDLKYK